MMTWTLVLCLASLLLTAGAIAVVGAGYLFCVLIYHAYRGDNNG